MKRTIVSLADLEAFDNGQFGLLFKQMIQRAVTDCWDRPVNELVRKVTVEVCITPNASQGGSLQSVNVFARLKNNMPNALSIQITGGVVFNADGEPDHILYNDLSTDDPRQMTIDETPPTNDQKEPPHA